MVETLQLGHSPDPDDAFMFYALAADKIETDGLKFEHILKDIESLNQWALKGQLEITAVSVHAYAYLADRYAVLRSGASVGDGYGPIVVAREEMTEKGLRDKCIGVPGKLTSAFLAMQLYLDKFEPVFIAFDHLMDAVRTGAVDAALLIHEGQLTHGLHGLKKIVDLGEWWKKETGLPLPLGINVIRKDLGEDRMRKISSILSGSIKWGLRHRGDALQYALQFGRGISEKVGDQFVEMYVNDFTLDLGERGRKGIEELYRRAAERKLIPQIPAIQFI